MNCGKHHHLLQHTLSTVSSCDHTSFNEGVDVGTTDPSVWEKFLVHSVGDWSTVLETGPHMTAPIWSMLELVGLGLRLMYILTGLRG